LHVRGVDDLGDEVVQCGKFCMLRRIASEVLLEGRVRGSWKNAAGHLLGIVFFVEPDAADSLLGDEANHVVRDAFADEA
jgi:hypothetical protein